MPKEKRVDIHLPLSDFDNCFIVLKQYWVKGRAARALLFKLRSKQANAVTRNRIKRITREYLRRKIPSNSTIIVSLACSKLMKSQSLKANIRNALLNAIKSLPCILNK